jgi:glycerol-3-phosphate O-acyltransferase
MIVIKSVAKYFWLRITGKFKGFGTASVAFGAPLSLSSFPVEKDLTSEVAHELMGRIRTVVPVLSAPLVARAIVVSKAETREAIESAVNGMLSGLKEKRMPLPKRDVPAIVDETLSRFSLRDLVDIDGSAVRAKGDGADVLGYYANSIAHHFPE